MADGSSARWVKIWVEPIQSGLWLACLLAYRAAWMNAGSRGFQRIMVTRAHGYAAALRGKSFSRGATNSLAGRRHNSNSTSQTGFHRFGNYMPRRNRWLAESASESYPMRIEEL